jgi:radical SAM superfamily enzyme YgiQ (UPF0313 family)
MESPPKKILFVSFNISTIDPNYKFLSNVPFQLKFELLNNSNIHSNNIIIQQFNNSCNIKKVVENILKINPKIIGFSIYVWNYKLILKIVAAIRRINKNVIIILGGPFVKFNIKDLLINNNYIDYLIHEYSFNSFSRFIKHIYYLKKINNKNLNKFEGLVYKLNNQIKIIKQKNLLYDINDENSFILNKPIFNEYKFFKPTAITYETSSGCINNCYFCQWSSKKITEIDLKRVFLELLKLFTIRSLCKILISDADFLRNESRAIKILNFIQKNKPKRLKIQIECNPINISSNIIKIMSKCKHFIFSFAIQSLNSKALLLMNRNYNIKQILLKLKLINKIIINNNEVKIGIIYGLPGDNLNGFIKTINKIIKMNIKIEISRLILLPGTQFFKLKNELGIITYKNSYLVQSNKTFIEEDMEIAAKISFYLRIFYSKNNLIIRRVLFSLVKYQNVVLNINQSYLEIIIEYFNQIINKKKYLLNLSFSQIEESSPEIINLQNSELVNVRLSKSKYLLLFYSLFFCLNKLISILISKIFHKRFNYYQLI